VHVTGRVDDEAAFRLGFGIDDQTFDPLVRVQVAGRRYPGWIHIPGQATGTR
jgi:hypothetical protein